MAQAVAQERTVIIEDESLREFIGGFTSIPNRILRNGEISLGARMCYSMLLSYAWQDDFCFPAQTRLAEDLGIGERTVRQYLKELRDAGLITWKQRGLNRPNIYQILKLPTLTPAPASNGHPGPADSAAPERQRASGQDRHSASAYKDPLKNTQKVVNAVTANDLKTPSKSRTKKVPTISDRALRSKYQLTDDQIGRVHWLVEKQTEILSHGDRNHGYYVKRAAEAVRDGDGDFLDHQLGEFKQAATEIAVASRPAYFHAMYTEALQKHRTEADASPIPQQPNRSLSTSQPQRLGETFTDLFHPPQEQTPEDPRARLIADAERRGFPVPDHIRTADIRAVNRWWAALAANPKRQA